MSLTRSTRGVLRTAGAAAIGCLFVALALLTAPDALSAQEAAVVQGRVTSPEGNPVSGAQVSIPSLQVGTLTGSGGTFSFTVPGSQAAQAAGAVELRVQLVGFQAQSAQIDLQPGARVTQNFQLEQQPLLMEGLTVTAMGIARQRRSLGYAADQLDTEDVAEVPADNFVSNLQGKVAGAVIRSSPYPGGSTRIVLRGANSLTGENGPVFVVDGVPVSNSTGSTATDAYGGFDYGNAMSMLDPNNIESISVLKGANAAALYGSRASNGVIVIETKSGRGAGGVGLTASQTVEMARPLVLPDYQNQYGQGRGNCVVPGPGCEGQFKFVDGTGNGINDGVDESWGPPLNGQPIDQFFGKSMPWTAHPDNVSSFLETAWTTRTHAAINASSETSHGRFSVTYSDNAPMAPGSSIKQANLQLRGGFDLSDRASVEAGAQYIREEGLRRPSTGYDSRNFMQQFNWFGRQVDMGLLENWQCVDDRFYCQGARKYSPYANWNYNYHDNPYFEQFGHNYTDQTDRIIGSVQASYDLLDWLTASARTGVDWYREDRKREYHVGSQAYIDGGFLTDAFYNREHNTNARLSTDAIDLIGDFALTVNGGGNIRISEFNNETVFVGQLSVPGVYNTSNSAGIPQTDQTLRRKKVYSVFGDAELSYKDWWFVSGTGRNDWSSTLPEENRSYFYPSVSTSFVFTDALGIDSDVLTYGKLRGSWARVGNDTDPYQLETTIPKGVQWGSIVGYTIPGSSKNPNLKPEQTDSWEAGAELELWGGRAGVSYTWYKQTTTDLIMPVQISYASGFGNTVVNAGDVENTGHEVQLTGTPIQTNDFSWDVNVNWGTNDNKVVRLAGDLETLRLGGFFGLDLIAKVGEPYGALYGWNLNRDENGNLILYGDPGLPATDFQKEVLGNTNPDWTGAIGNSFSYKDLDVSFLLDFSQGGQIFSGTNWFNKWTGTVKETLEGRENGACDPGLLVEGVTPDGQPISNRVCPEAYWSLNPTPYYDFTLGMYDASYVKLRQARIGYQLPGSWAQAIGFENLHLALIGRNLLLFTDVPHIDPEFAVTNGNWQGLEYGIYPTGRTIGLTLSVTP